MSTYCVSDLHGERERFHKLLRLIGYGSGDRLYIIGDVVDRGPEPVRLLQEIFELPGAVMMLGNHEYMLLSAIDEDSYEIVEEKCGLWRGNGGSVTIRQLQGMPASQRRQIVRRIETLPAELLLSVKGRPFYLVHGKPSGNLEDSLWGRVEAEKTYRSVEPGTIIIFGHTPTWYYTREPQGTAFGIWHGLDRIGIDCGCGHMSIPQRRLGCLRLEDMAEFYV